MIRSIFRKFFLFFAIFLPFILCQQVYAAAYQLVFNGINYSNPAALNSVQQGEFIIGGTTFSSHFHFTGSDGPLSGSTTSNRVDFLPYGRLAYRLSQQWVIGLDITQPFYVDIQYPPDSVIRYSSVKTIVRDTDISPKLSYQVNQQLALGAGLNFNNLYNGTFSFDVLVPPPTPSFGVMTNRGSSWATGWNIGLFYAFKPTTLLNLSYYSRMVQRVTGTSVWGSITSPRSVANVPMPATSTLNVIQILSPQWILSGTLRYLQWNRLRYLVFQSTAIGNVTIPELYTNGWAGQLAARYQFNQQWAGLAALNYESNVQSTLYRSVALPTYSIFAPSVGFEYAFMQSLSAKLLYSHGFSKPSINTTSIIGQQVVGRENINADLIDFSITYKI